MKKLMISLFMLLFILACSPAADMQGDVNAIYCETYSRSSVTLEGHTQSSTAIFELSLDDKEWSDMFSDMALNAKYRDDEYERRGLNVVVTDSNTGRQLASYLYQFQADKFPSNQFEGGHDFIGLANIYHPDSSSELQFSCKTK